MTSADVERVGQVRQRLREVIAGRVDPAVRILELDAPPPSDSAPLRLNRRFAVVSGMSERAKRAVDETINGLFTGTPGPEALEGTVVIDGDHQPLWQPRTESEAQNAGAAAIFADHYDAVGANSIAWADPADLAAVVAALETALELTEAELRGADIIAREHRTAGLQPAEHIDLATADDARTEIDAAIATLGQIGSQAERFDRLEGLLLEITMTAPVVTDDSAVEQYSAAIERLLPTDSATVRTELEAKLSAARQARDGHRRERAAIVDRIIQVLDELGVDSDPANAVERAERVLVERGEIDRLRQRLESQREHTGPAPAVIASPPQPTDIDPALERRRAQLRRRRQSQQRLLAATREQLAFARRDGATWSELPGRTVTPTNGEGRPLPILVEDPTVDLPSRHAASALSVLLRLSELTQVICLSDDADLARWCKEIGDRVGQSAATGWFREEAERC